MEVLNIEVSFIWRVLNIEVLYNMEVSLILLHTSILLQIKYFDDTGL